MINSIEISRIAEEAYKEKRKSWSWKNPALIACGFSLALMLLYVISLEERIGELNIQVRALESRIKNFQSALQLDSSMDDYKFKKLDVRYGR